MREATRDRPANVGGINLCWLPNCAKCIYIYSQSPSQQIAGVSNGIIA